MMGHRNDGIFRLVLAVAWLMTMCTATHAQVDWSDLFPEEGQETVSPPAPPPPPPVHRPRPVKARVAPAPKQAPPARVRVAPPKKKPVQVRAKAARPPKKLAPAPTRAPARAKAKPAIKKAPVARAHVAAAPRAAAAATPKAVASSKPATEPRPPSQLVPLADIGLSEGMLLDRGNAAEHASLLTPGMQWAVEQGWRIHVTKAKPLRPPSAYLLATEKFSSQVALGPGGLSLTNYVAGRPFPVIDPNEPDAAVKMMWNYYYNYYVIDDVSQQAFEPRTGTIADDGHLQVERAYVVAAYRKMNYNGRLYVSPKPKLPNPEHVRFKESLHPIIQPFDLKGVGATFYRYLDPEKQDDNWIYLPQLRRVRRMSSAQRSDALFGQDTDADAFAGYNGQISWMDFTLLGEQVILMPVHTEHIPAKWQEPEDWAFEDVWEPRKVWVIEARSKSRQYAYSKRVLYVDQEAYLIPCSDSYDRAGQLWKAQVNMYAQRRRLTPDSRISVYHDPMVFQLATVIMDTQLRHATSTAIPSKVSKARDSYLLNMGSRSGVTEEYFTIANLIATGK